MGRESIEFFKGKVDKAWEAGIGPYRDIINELENERNNNIVDKVKEEIPYIGGR